MIPLLSVETPNATLIEARDVARVFSGVRAVSGVTLRLEQGELVGLIGPNGSGKTTLLNILTKMTALSEGLLLVNGVDASRWPTQRLARAGVSRTFQNIRLFGNLTVAENVEAGLVASGRSGRGDRRRQASSHLERMGIAHLASRFARTLPYGDQRRVEIARALATQPQFLLLDEPAAGMNEAETDELLQALRSIHAETGIGLLLVEHDLSLVFRLAKRIVVLNEGRVIAEGTSAEIRIHPDVMEAYLGPALAIREGDEP